MPATYSIFIDPTFDPDVEEDDLPECAGGCGGVATLDAYCEGGCEEDA
jgi:hypothetical protein